MADGSDITLATRPALTRKGWAALGATTVLVGAYFTWRWFQRPIVIPPAAGKVAGKPASKPKAEECANLPKTDKQVDQAWKVIEPEARKLLSQFAASRHTGVIVPNFPTWETWTGTWWRWAYEQSMIIAFARAKLGYHCFYSAELATGSSLARRLDILSDDAMSLLGDAP